MPRRAAAWCPTRFSPTPSWGALGSPRPRRAPRGGTSAWPGCRWDGWPGRWRPYLSFVSSLLLRIGLSFETPIALFFLAKLGVVNARQLARYRRYALVGAFIIGAIITPTPDPVNQTIVSVPIYLLYELGVLLARFA